MLANENVPQANVKFETIQNNKESKNKICKTGLMFDERSKTVQNPIVDGLPIKSTNSIPSNMGSLKQSPIISNKSSTHAGPIALIPLAELIAQIKQGSAPELVSSERKVPPLVIKQENAVGQQKKGFKRLTVKSPTRSANNLELNERQLQKPVGAGSSIKTHEKLNQNADISLNFIRKPNQCRPFSGIPKKKNCIQGTPTNPNAIADNNSICENQLQNQLATNIVSNQMGPEISRNTQMKQRPIMCNRKRLPSLSVGKDIKNLEKAKQHFVNEDKVINCKTNSSVNEISDWNYQTNQIKKPQENLPTVFKDNANALPFQKKPIQCGLNTMNPIQQAPLQAPTISNQVKARLCSIGKDPKMFGEQKQFGKHENGTEKEILGKKGIKGTNNK